MAQDNAHDIFASEPLPPDPTPRVDIFRVPAGGVGKVIVLSDDVCKAQIHFFGSRSIPHRRVGACLPCDHGSEMRWYGYLAIQGPTSSRPKILEVTAPVIFELEETIKLIGTLRGSVWNFYRKPRTKNGAIYSERTGTFQEPEKLLPAPPVQGIMLKVWGLDQTGNGDSHLQELDPVKIPIDQATKRAAKKRKTSSG